MIPRGSKALAIDPGYAADSGGCACAYGERGELCYVMFQRPAEFARNEAGRGEIEHVIVEQPQQDGRSWNVPPAVLIRLAWDGAALAGLYAGASGAVLHAPTVNEWKGSENKVPMHRRLWKILTVSERVVLGGIKTGNAIDAAAEKGALCRWSKSGAELYPKAFKTHNLLDAAALLMWALGRLEKVG